MLRNPANFQRAADDFARTYSPTFVFGNIVSMYRMLPGLRGFWPMTALSTTTVLDFSGNGNHPTINSITLGFTGLIPFSHYAAGGDYMSRADNATLDITGTEAYMETKGLTIGAWVNFDTISAANHVLFGKNLTPNISYLLYYNGGVGTLGFTFQISTDGTTAVPLRDATNTATAGNWYFAAGRFVPSTEMAVYVNANKFANTSSIPASIFSGSAALEFGSVNAGASSGLDGKLALCFLCATALPDATIRTLFQHTRALFGV